jgi:transcriptional regulator with XRE-family HTH domain
MVTMSIGDYMYKRIKDLREDNDYTQEYIAKYLKINRVVYNRYENGIREIPISLLIKLSKLYQTSIDYIVGLSDKK